MLNHKHAISKYIFLINSKNTIEMIIHKNDYKYYLLSLYLKIIKNITTNLKVLNNWFV